MHLLHRQFYPKDLVLSLRIILDSNFSVRPLILHRLLAILPAHRIRSFTYYLQDIYFYTKITRVECFQSTQVNRKTHIMIKDEYEIASGGLFWFLIKFFIK